MNHTANLAQRNAISRQLSALAKQIRRGDQSLAAEYDRLEAEVKALRPAPPVYRSWIELPIAEAMWRRDARDVEGARQ